MSIEALYVPLEEGNLRLEPLREAHREALRAACAQDSEIWAIYPFCYVGAHFDPQFDSLLAGRGALRLCRHARRRGGRNDGVDPVR